MTEIRWLAREAVEMLHAESLSEHGGLRGLRDEGLFESALARPMNLHAYEPDSDIFALAACYAVALATNHPFNDGNKRVAFIAALTFLLLNGLLVVVDQAEAAATMIDVATGRVAQPELASWLKQHAKPRPEVAGA